MNVNFARLRDAKRSVYRAWDYSADDADSYLVSKTQLRQWMETGITPVKSQAEAVVDAAVSDVAKDDSPSELVSAEIPESTVEEAAATNGDTAHKDTINEDVEMATESSAELPTLASETTKLSNHSIVCPHGLLNPLKADQTKRIGFVRPYQLPRRIFVDDYLCLARTRCVARDWCDDRADPLCARRSLSNVRLGNGCR